MARTPLAAAAPNRSPTHPPHLCPQSQRSKLQGRESGADRTVAELAAQRADVERDRAALHLERTTVERNAKSLAARELAIKATEEDLSQRSGELDALQAKLKEDERRLVAREAALKRSEQCVAAPRPSHGAMQAGDLPEDGSHGWLRVRYAGASLRCGSALTVPYTCTRPPQGHHGPRCGAEGGGR